MEIDMSCGSSCLSQNSVVSRNPVSDMGMNCSDWKTSFRKDKDWSLWNDNSLEDDNQRDVLRPVCKGNWLNSTEDKRKKLMFKISCSSRTDIDLHQWGIDQPVPLVTIRRAICSSHRRYSFSKRLEPYRHHLSDRSKFSSRRTALCVHSASTFSDLSSTPTLTVTSALSSTNKSNPGSPVKSHPSFEHRSTHFLQVGSPLVRSKSLDNISLCVDSNEMVDTMSYEISNLQLAN